MDGTSTRVTLHHTGWGEGGEWDQADRYFDRSWGTVRANLKKRFEQGPQDWAPWLKQLEVWRAQQATQAAQAAQQVQMPASQAGR